MTMGCSRNGVICFLSKSPVSNLYIFGEAPGFAFSWLDEKNSFLAWNIATTIIKVLQRGNSLVDASQFRPVVTVNRKAGNSSYISGCLSNTMVPPIIGGLLSPRSSSKCSIISPLPSRSWSYVPVSVRCLVDGTGPVDVSSCIARWKFETNVWQIFSRIVIFIHHQIDKYGNPTIGLHEFDASAVENKTKLALPVADFRFQDYCDGSTSVLNGTGLNKSKEGQVEPISSALQCLQYLLRNKNGRKDLDVQI
ncbi:hypothetical protein MLD38_031093 [Melastoma candidum]|uniref:Uncharacterized protein n=1 Tax=Melastoma candidum TaxID=119954 RepID=A0ACB9MQS0_9MYRT|nr:hypothetical protein MLD38_031093 [Melastoma candidum]